MKKLKIFWRKSLRSDDELPLKLMQKFFYDMLQILVENGSISLEEGKHIAD